MSVYCLEIVAATGITCTDAEKQSLKVLIFIFMIILMINFLIFIMLIKDDYNAVINSDNFASHRNSFSFGNIIFT